MLAANRLGGVLISSQPNFSWLTAGGTNGVDLSREAGNGALLVRSDGKRFVLANRIEMPRLLSEELAAEEFEPVEFPWEEEKASPDFLPALAMRLLGKDKGLASDIGPGPGSVTTEAAVARCRYRLISSEVERFRVASKRCGRSDRKPGAKSHAGRNGTSGSTTHRRCSCSA